MNAVLQITENLEGSSGANVARSLGASINLEHAYPTDMQAAFASLNATSDVNGSARREEAFRRAGLR